MADWPTYWRGTVEDLDTHLDNYGSPVPDSEYEVQVVTVGAPYVAGDGAHWHPAPYRITGLDAGRYDAYTRWNRGNGAKVIDHVGDPGLPSFELR